MIIFSIILFLLIIFISGFSEGLMDLLQFHYHSSIIKNFKNNIFWDPSISWKNKYKNGDPNYGEKFLFSTTLFVSLTDGWHLFKLIKNISIFIGASAIGYLSKDLIMLISLIIISRAFYGLGFSISYYLLKNK
jgi:hypothetical protein